MSGPKTIHPIAGKEPIRKHATCGIEYFHGELYFDRMGRVARMLAKAARGWVGDLAVSNGQSQLLNPQHNLQLAVSPGAAVISSTTDDEPREIEDDAINRLAEEAEFAFAIIVDEFELAQFHRVGYREHFAFACESIEETQRWQNDLGLLPAPASMLDAFGKLYATSWAAVFESEECRYRIELKGIERNASVPIGSANLEFKYSRAKHLNRKEYLDLMKSKRSRQLDPYYAAVLDIEAFLWDSQDSDFGIREFVLRHMNTNLDLFRKCLQTGRK